MMIIIDWSRFAPADDRVQHPLGPAVPVPQPGAVRRPPARPGRVPRRGPLPLPRSAVPRREQAQGVPAAHGQVSRQLIQGYSDL